MCCGRMWTRFVWFVREELKEKKSRKKWLKNILALGIWERKKNRKKRLEKKDLEEKDSIKNDFF